LPKQPIVVRVNLKKNLALLLVLVFLAASCLIVPLQVKADYRTLVVPDDYQTISSAVGNATAGDTIFVKKGIYEGPINQTLVIDKTLSLVGEDANDTILNLYPAYTEWWILTQPYISYSNAITVDANDFKLSGFTISTHGSISINEIRTQVTGNKIATESAAGLVVSGSYCNITDNVSGGLISLYSSFNVIVRNSFANILLSGDSNIISNNTCGNLRLSNARQNIISGNKIETSALHASGIMVARNSSKNLFYANNVSGFAAAVAFNSAENNTFYCNNFVNNDIEQVSIYIWPAHNFWDNGQKGNYWDDYNGTDSNRDGIGDTPYVINECNIDYYPLMEPFDIEGDAIVLPPPEPFPTILVETALAVVAVVCVGLLVYFRRRNHGAERLVKKS
jgi:hypothetical protein